MPWNTRTLALPASPPSVRLARDWVTGVLTEISREDLAESARLAVSELVTNAILHAEPPITVHVRGTVAHPRIEVTDQSLFPPLPVSAADAASVWHSTDFSWTTVGRGLELVACHARAWGADIEPGGTGKIVWFEPSAGPQEVPSVGAVFDLDEVITARTTTSPAPTEMLTLDLIGMPVELFARLRLHFSELGRELRLLAITDPERYPIAVEFSEAYLQIEQERRQAQGLEVLDRAIQDGVATVDLRYLIPPEAPRSMTRMGELIEIVYDTLTEESLLVVRPPEDLLALERWYVGEFVRQGGGLPPTPWSKTPPSSMPVPPDQRAPGES